MTRDEVSRFRFDFEKVTKQLEEEYGVLISLGTIRYDKDGLSAKMTAVKPNHHQLTMRENSGKTSFKVGDTVGIDSTKVSSDSSFIVLKVNIKNLKVRQVGGTNEYRVSPSLCFKK